MMASSTATLRPVYCAIAHLHQSVECALDVCRGVFHIAGATLSVGQAPRWRDVAIDADRERWIEWSKFYYGLDLAHAFAQTGDLRFQRTWERLVRSWLDQVPPDFGPTDALGRRLQNWVYAANIFSAAPAFAGFADGFDEQLVDGIRQHADYLQAHLTPERNHRTLELYALFVVALALPSTAAEEVRLQFAWRALQDNLEADFRPDGVHREHSTHYHMIVLRSFVAARENAIRAGFAIPRGYDDRLRRALAFGLACQRPDGTMPAFSDGDIGHYADLLVQSAAALDHTGGAIATGFPDAGYYIQRGVPVDSADAGNDQRHLIFDCGPLGDGGHGHYDALSIDAWCGRHLIVDPGRYTYDRSVEWRQWFKGTAAHNTVCVDGRDQVAYRPGKPKQRLHVRLLNRASTPLVDIVGGEVKSPQYDALHRRHVLLVANEYWLVLDVLDAPTAHDYDLRYHLAPDALDSIAVSAEGVAAPGVRLLLDGPGPIVIEPGWIAADYGVKVAAPIVSKRAVGCERAAFVTAIVPVTSANIATAQRLAVRWSDRGGVASVDGAGVRGESVDRIEWWIGNDGACWAAVDRRDR
jgi:heparinase II/III-like protein